MAHSSLVCRHTPPANYHCTACRCFIPLSRSDHTILKAKATFGKKPKNNHSLTIWTKIGQVKNRVLRLTRHGRIPGTMDGFEALMDELELLAEEENNQELRRRVKNARMAYGSDILRTQSNHYSSYEKVSVRSHGVTDLPWPAPYLNGVLPSALEVANCPSRYS